MCLNLFQGKYIFVCDNKRFQNVSRHLFSFLSMKNENGYQKYFRISTLFLEIFPFVSGKGQILKNKCSNCKKKPIFKACYRDSRLNNVTLWKNNKLFLKIIEKNVFFQIFRAPITLILHVLWVCKITSRLATTKCVALKKTSKTLHWREGKVYFHWLHPWETEKSVFFYVSLFRSWKML